MKKPTYQWDHHSDQPHIIRDKTAKRRLYALGAWGSLKTLITACIFLPVALTVKICRSHNQLPHLASKVGLCVNVESELIEKSVADFDQIHGYLEELNVQHLLMRVPIAKADSLDPFIELAERFKGRSLLIDILQNREHLDNPPQLEQSLRTIFETFAAKTTLFKIGNAINRRKWAFIDADEYFRFFEIAQRLRNKEFPAIKLIGGGVIDFELPNFIRSLLHFAPIKYDAVGALLYVDRRGAPENSQLGANLLGKIAWFKAIMHISPKTINELYISETNWPLKGTEPFAPAVGDCMVDENLQAAYLVRYYLLAFASGQVEAIYWHQLVAPGYGLIDNRVDHLHKHKPRKRRAYYAFATLNKLFQQATIQSFKQHEDVYLLSANNQQRRITAIWTNDIEQNLSIDKLDTLINSGSLQKMTIVDLTGNPVAPSDESITISGDATYFIEEIVS